MTKTLTASIPRERSSVPVDRDSLGMGQFVLVNNAIFHTTYPWHPVSHVRTVCFALDIDECSKNGSPCDENADCLNNLGSYTCSCKDGFTGNGTVCVGKVKF